MYVRLVTFQASMYFSMHELRQLCSLPDSEVPGLGTQWLKQVSLTLLIRYLAFMTLDWVVMADWMRDFTALDSEDEGDGGADIELGVEEELELELEEKGLGKPPKDILCVWKWVVVSEAVMGWTF